MGIKRPILIVLLLGVTSGVAWGQGTADGAVEKPASGARREEIRTKADYMDYDERTGWIRARGKVEIRKGGQRLQADAVVVNLKTEDVHAKGNVILRHANEKPIRGDELKGNFGTGTWQWMDVRGSMEDVRLLSSEKVVRNADETFSIFQGKVTTCEKEWPHCHYHVRARRVKVMPDEYMKIYGATWYFGPVPFLYLPYWYRDLEDGGFTLRVGHNSRWGDFALVGYEKRLNKVLKSITHVDFYEDRGVGFGQDFKWRNRTNMTGKVEFYYINDDQPVDEDQDAEALGIEEERYRVHLKHHYDFSPRDYLMLEAQYVSDINFRRDFFRREYRRQRTPENYATFTHREDYYTLNIDTVFRVNDFFTSVTRLPELSVEFMRQPIGDTFFYYEGATAFGNLEKLYPEGDTNLVDYSAFRIDTSHAIYRPEKLFRFLSVVPRAGYRGTYYSATRETFLSTNVVTTLSTNTAVTGAVTSSVVNASTSTNIVATDVETGAELRSLVQFGCEASFKAFKTWDNRPVPLRHIVEPYGNYTFIPEPNVLPENLYQFDSVDRLADRHTLQLGVRNKWQIKKLRKKKRYVWETVDLNTYTIVNMDPDTGEDAIENAYFNCEITPHKKLKFETRGVWGLDEGEFSRFDAELTLQEANWETELDYRYRNADSSLFYGDLRFKPNPQWTLEFFGRYEFEDSRMEEQGAYVWRNLDCMSFKLGASVIPGYERADGTEEEDEWTVAVEWWLTAFPNFRVE